MDATTALPKPGRRPASVSKRLLALRGDAALVARLRAGEAAAFEVLYERHIPAILSFCRHMLGSLDEAEDAVQTVFVSAHRHLLADAREINLKPWLYAIARNRCLSILRARREHVLEDVEVSTRGLDEVVQQRAELRSLLADLGDLPEDQRAALVLTELGDLSHAEVAEVLECEAAQVKGFVFRARSGLAERREAREASCEEIRVELANARGGGLRRGRLSHHLKSCPSCAAYMKDLRRQRRMMGLILPVAPTIGLKDSVLGALAAGGGGAAGGGAAAAGGAAATAGAFTSGAGAASLAAASAAKIAAVAVLAGGAGVAIVADRADRSPSSPAQRPEPAQAPSSGASSPLGPAGTREVPGQARGRGRGDSARRRGGSDSDPPGSANRTSRAIAGDRSKHDGNGQGNGKGQGKDRGQHAGRGPALARGGTGGNGRGATGKPETAPVRPRAKPAPSPNSDGAPAPRGPATEGDPPAKSRGLVLPQRPRAKDESAPVTKLPRAGRVKPAK